MKKPLFFGVAFLFVLLLFLSLMLTGLCGGGLMLEYQKSAAAAQPRQHPSVFVRTRS